MIALRLGMAALAVGTLLGCGASGGGSTSSSAAAPTSFSPNATDQAYLDNVANLTEAFTGKSLMEVGYDTELVVALGRGYCSTVVAAGGSGGAQAIELARLQVGMDLSRQKALGIMANTAKEFYCPTIE